MARPKEFDPDVALRRAMELFWQRGYEATSLADLVDRLGVSRASLYATFGDKEQLYRQALDLYLAEHPVDWETILSQPGPVLPLIREVVTRFAVGADAADGSGSCLVVNAAIERMAVDPDVARRVEASWDSMETMLTMALRRARVQGEISATADPKAQARFVLVLLQGFRVFAHARPNPRRLSDAVEQAMSTLK